MSRLGKTLFPGAVPGLDHLRGIDLRHEIEGHLLEDLVLKIAQDANQPATPRPVAIPCSGSDPDPVEADELDLAVAGFQFVECTMPVLFVATTEVARPFDHVGAVQRRPVNTAGWP